jgi:hypothetical protein
MPAQYNQVLIGLLDNNGRPATMFWTSIDQTAGPAADYAALAASVQAISDAAVVCVQFQSTLLIEASPSDGPYNTVTDRCQILMKIMETGKPLTLGLVAPKSGIFLPDHKTLDLSNPDVIALQDEMMATIGDKDGNAMGPIRRGYRTEA